MNAFEAAEKNGKATALQQELEQLFNPYFAVDNFMSVCLKFDYEYGSRIQRQYGNALGRYEGDENVDR
jgi:hypothetical protein